MTNISNGQSYIYKETTESIKIEVCPQFIPERSNIEVNYYFYSYTVTIINNSDSTYQLLKRYWIIRDGQGSEEYIQGDGIVGLRPVLAPGESFQYTSFCPLRTSTGSMRGKYELKNINNSSDEKLKVNIPLFFLRMPDTFH